ncbi:MAG TPA: hypothetical protein VLT35_01690, partial [Methanocella sp.]|nr:hypothetical protein [Methanocella sp.]
MRTSYSIILLIFLVTVALALSGCSSSNTTATPTPSGGYTVGTPTPTPAASASPAATAGTLGSLYDMSKVSWFEYQTQTSTAGITATTDMKMEFLGKEMHDGKMEDHMRTTISMSI